MLYCIYFFLIGAFAGWLLECVFKYFSKNFRATPGILNTPFCILYGLGTLVLSVIITKVTNNFWLLFFLSMLVLTVMEYITFILLQKVYGVKLWDYRDMTFSINEKVCLEFALVWGLLGALYIKYVLPIITNFYVRAQGMALSVSVYLLFGIVVVDFLFSSHILIKNKSYVLAEENV